MMITSLSLLPQLYLFSACHQLLFILCFTFCYYSHNILNDNGDVWVAALDLLLERMKKDNFPFQKVVAVTGSGQQHGMLLLTYFFLLFVFFLLLYKPPSIFYSFIMFFPSHFNV